MSNEHLENTRAALEMGQPCRCEGEFVCTRCKGLAAVDALVVAPQPAPLPGVLVLDTAVDDAVEFLSEQYQELAPYVGELTAHISDLTRRLAEAESHQCEICKKNEIERCRAEARVKKLEEDGFDVATRCLKAEARVRELVAEAAKRPLASDDEQTIADLEAFKARVMEWARGRCCTCSGMTEDKYGQRNLYTEKCYGCSEYTGGEDGEPNLWEPAWEVKS